MNTEKLKNDAHSHDGHRERLRERYVKSGMCGLANYEVIEFLLTMLIPRKDVKPIAKELISKFKNLRGIIEAPIGKLMEVEGVGNSTATYINFIKNLTTLYILEELEIPEDEISTISKLIKFFKSRLSSKSNEVLEMLCFDSQLKIIPGGSVKIIDGSVSSANVDIRRIVEIAITKGATSIAISHNHPSGNPRPSLDDITLTKRLSAACKPININLIEHVIVGKNQCFSFRRDGRFDDLYDTTVAEGRLRGRGVAEKKKTLKNK